MHRCSQVLSDACMRELAVLVQRSRPVYAERLNFNSSLKNLVLSDPKISIRIDSATQFSVFELILLCH